MKDIHCPRCGQSFLVSNFQAGPSLSEPSEMKHSEVNVNGFTIRDLKPKPIHLAGDRNLKYEFRCLTCFYEFKVKYDFNREIFYPYSASIEYEKNIEFEPKPHLIFNDEENPVHFRLKEKWQEVLEDFNNTILHKEFIDLCEKLNQIKFALDRYQYLKTALGDDVEVNKRLSQLELKSLYSQTKSIQIETETLVLPLWRRLGTTLIIGISFILIGSLLKELRSLLFFGICIVFGLLFYGIKK